MFSESRYNRCQNPGLIKISCLLDNDKIDAVRKLKQALPADFYEICETRQRLSTNAQSMDQDTGGDAETNDARIEENIIELKFHMALEHTIESLDVAEDQWDVGPAESLPGYVTGYLGSDIVT